MKRFLCPILAFCLLTTVLSGCFGGRDGVDRGGTGTNNNGGAAQVKYDKFDNGMVSLDIPKGWKVAVAPGDAVHYLFVAFDPKNDDYRLFFSMKLEGFIKTQEMKDFYNRYYTSIMSDLPVIDPQTTENVFRVMTETLNVCELGSFPIPDIREMQQTASLGTNDLGGEIIRGKFVNGSTNHTVDGVFSATIKDFSLYYITALIVYGAVFYSAPEGELEEWQPTLNHCIATVSFSKKFVDEFNEQEQGIMNTFRDNQAYGEHIADVIMQAWEARNAE